MPASVAVEMRRVRAVDHVVGRARRRRLVHLRDRLLQALPRRQASVGLHREGDRDRHARGLAARVTPTASLALVMVMAVTMSASFSANTPIWLGVIGLASSGYHRAGRSRRRAGRRSRTTTACARPGTRCAAPASGRSTRRLASASAAARIAELVAPVGTRPPGRALQDEARAVGPGDLGVAGEVAAQGRGAGLVLQEVEGGEMRQLAARRERSGWSRAAVGQEQAGRQSAAGSFCTGS